MTPGLLLARCWVARLVEQQGDCHADEGPPQQHWEAGTQCLKTKPQTQSILKSWLSISFSQRILSIGRLKS